MTARTGLAQQRKDQMTNTHQKIPCPFVYARGKRCTGHIVEVRAFKADLSWTMDASGKWTFNAGEPRSHYHLRCSEKGNHAGYDRPDAEQLKYYASDLPPELFAVIERS
jgi:hypothetical protein